MSHLSNSPVEEKTTISQTMRLYKVAWNGIQVLRVCMTEKRQHQTLFDVKNDSLGLGNSCYVPLCVRQTASKLSDKHTWVMVNIFQVVLEGGDARGTYLYARVHRSLSMFCVGSSYCHCGSINVVHLFIKKKRPQSTPYLYNVFHLRLRVLLVFIRISGYFFNTQKLRLGLALRGAGSLLPQ